ncbi:hypothetical protein LJB86_00400 [Deltaproteobacteria bacterium OttesenSCG-928-M10]|nr:hypothetical protein [Deltaproteobacteria bacterium OttesenSCG-928-M10]
MKKFDMARRRDHEQVRQKVGIADFTMGLMEITGDDARPFLDEMCVNDIAGLKPGHVVYTSLLNEQAMMIDDVTVFCFSDNRFWMITAWAGTTMVWLDDHRGTRAVSFEDLSSHVALWTIQGPDSRRMLASYLDIDITGMKYYTFMENRAGGIPVIVSRTGFTGELGFEIFADQARIGAIVGDLERVGKRFGARVVSPDATFESLPTEKGLVLMRDFGAANPLELGMGWTVKWDKKFIGRERLLEIKEKGVTRKLKGFICDDDEIDVENGSPVLVDGQVVGKVTTANYGYSVEKSIGYAMLDVKHAENGARITIVTVGKELAATVTDRVFYDKERVRVNAEVFEPRVPDIRTEEFMNGGREKPFKGVYGAIPTPFLRDETLDKKALKSLMDFMVEGGQVAVG